MIAQLLIWWLVIQVIGLAGLPLTRFVFRHLPDQGYAFSKTFGLLLAGYLAWLVAMLGLVSFGTPLLVVALVAVAALGLLAGPRPDAATWRADLRGWLRTNWRMIVGYEVLFLIALVFMAFLRAHESPGPNPWGTERPMDFAFFNAIQRSSVFPPHDPWLAGYTINYYYFGYMLMAVMGMLSRLEPGVAYNLSLALIFALSALGIAGIVLNLIGLTAPQRDAADQPETSRSRRRRQIGQGLAVVLAVVMVLFAANQGGVLQLITGSPMVLALNDEDLGRAILNGLGPRTPLTLSRPFISWGDAEPTTTITPTDMARDFNWWNPSRALWDNARTPDDQVRYYTITEFPFFSFWLGDMHPHVMALPFGLLALALALHTLARPTAPLFALGRRGWLELALTGIVLGSLYAINSWDFPTYTLLFLGALLLLFVRLGAARAGAAPQPVEPAAVDLTAPQRYTAEQEPPAEQADIPPDPNDLLAPLRRVWWRQYLGMAALAGISAVAMLAPFYLTFRSLVGGKDPLTSVPILATISRTIGVVSWTKTSLATFLIIFGLFLIPLVVFVIAQGRGETLARRAAADSETAEPVARRSASAVGFALLPAAAVPQAIQLMPWVLLITAVAGLLLGFPLVVLLALAIYAALLAMMRVAETGVAFALWAFAAVCLVCFGTELIYIRDVFELRMNTIFKFYYQAWLIWGTLAGYALWWLATQRFSLRRPGGYLLTALVAALLAGALVYPWFTAGNALRTAPLIGLEGITPRQHTPAGAAAITWLREHVPGDAVILEAAGQGRESYDPSGQGIGGVSASTGLATVIGWPGHEDQWRGGDPETSAQIDPRLADVATIYSTTDVTQARELLGQYKVRYVYIGEAERSRYPAEGLAKFDQLGTVVFQQDEVTIYEIPAL